MSKILDLRALRAFVATAAEGNVSRAAAKLHLTQPAVSLQLRQLADITGVELFTRTRNGVLLTRDGATLLQHAERALQAQAEFLQAAQRLKGSVRGTLRVGTILDPEFTRLGAFLSELVALAPELRPGPGRTARGRARRGLHDHGCADNEGAPQAGRDP
jgi:DNA-binding transcriptional LysR family regulator